MKLVKCPRCELNYITESEKYCKVCLREMKGDRSHDETELCSICNVEPAMPGKDVCYFCMREMNGVSDGSDRSDDDGENVTRADLNTMDSVSTMEEIVPDLPDDDIPAGMADSLEQMADDEDDRNEEEDSEEEDDV